MTVWAVSHPVSRSSPFFVILLLRDTSLTTRHGKQGETSQENGLSACVHVINISCCYTVFVHGVLLLA